jgi:soluble lytic murein transglycosylase-like protein
LKNWKRKENNMRNTKKAVRHFWSLMMAFLIGALIAFVFAMYLQLFQLNRSVVMIESYLGEAFGGVKPQEISEISQKIQQLSWITKKRANLYALHICLEAMRNGMDPKLIYCLIFYESRFKEGAVSKKNCLGLMQLNPKIFSLPKEELTDPRTNIALGIKHLAICKQRARGNRELAVRLYHGDPYDPKSIQLGQRVMKQYRKMQ